MKLESKRIFISDLPETVLQNDVEEKFSKFGSVTAVEIKQRKDVGPKNTSQFFAFINIDVDNHSLQQCFEEFSNKKWKGQYVEIQLAKESFLDRLRKEREQSKVESNGICTTKQVDPQVCTPIINETFKPHLTSKVNGDHSKVKKYETSSSSSESEDEDKKTEIKFKNKINEESIEDVYTDIVVKNNRNKKFDNKIESVGFEPIIKYEIGKKLPKSKDPARTKANEARLNSIQDMKKAYQQQKSAVQQALSKIDYTPKNKIVFDENDTQVSLKRKSEYRNEKSDKKSLFDDDEVDNDDGKFNFDVKKQFQGEKGQKLFELQSRYKNDERFQMDSRFAENEDAIVENITEYNDDEEMTQEEEKSKQYEILEQVLGKKVTKMNINEGVKRKGMLRFDPNQPEHSKYEMQASPEKKKRKKHDNEAEKEDNIVPEVSKETFYQVTDTLKEALQEKESFSLLSMFGTTNSNEQGELEEEEQSADIIKKTKNSLENDTNPFKYDSSTDEEGEKEGKIVKTKKKLNAEESQKVGLGPSRLWTESFFFKEDDYRLQEGVDFIRRLEVEDKSEFLKLRRNIKEIVRAKVRNNQRKNKPFKKKLGGSGRKKMIRVKKALKR